MATTPRRRARTMPDSHEFECSVYLEPTTSAAAASTEYSAELASLIDRADSGMKSGVEPILADGAMGGTYFLRDKGRAICVVCKPGDEEPNACNNPYNEQGGSTDLAPVAYKGGIIPGTGMFREVVAFVLDQGFAGVPPTQLARVYHRSLFRRERSKGSVSVEAPAASDPAFSWKSYRDSNMKLASVQQYARHDCCAEDMSSSKFSVEDVQRIAVMDIRICNLDRHEGNLLVSSLNPFIRHKARCPSPVSFASKARAIPGPIFSSESEVEGPHSVFACSAPVGGGLGPMDNYFLKCSTSTLTSTPTSTLTSTYTSTHLNPNPFHNSLSVLNPVDSLDNSPVTSVASSMTTSISCNSLNSRSSATSASSGSRLIPIDHGYCLPHCLQMEGAAWAWQHWTQTNEPTLQCIQTYIREIDIDFDIQTIRDSVGADAIPESSLLTLRVCTSWLKKGTAAGLSLFHLSTALTEDIDDYDCSSDWEASSPTRLQRLVQECISKAICTINASGRSMGPEEQLAVLCRDSHLPVFLAVLEAAIDDLVEETLLKIF